MLTPKLPEEERSVVALPQKLRIIAIEDGGKPLMFVLPPMEDLAEIEELGPTNFSLSEFVEKKMDDASLFECEYERLAAKRERFEDSAIYLNRLAILAGLTKRHEEESQLLKHAMSLSDQDYFAHRFGENLMLLKDPSVEEFFQSMDLENDVAANLRLAAFCVERQDLLGAREYVSKSIDIDSFDFGARLFDGALHLVNGSYERAIHSFRIALQERPASSSAHCNIAIAYLGLKNTGKAMASLKRAVALDPLNSNAVALLADLASLLGRNEDSVTTLLYFLSFEQKDAAMWSRLARASFAIGKFDDAIAALKRQASISDSSAVWNNLGVSYAAIGNRERAWTAFHHAMRMDEKTPGRSYFLAVKNIARIIANLNHYEELKNFATAAILRDIDETIFLDDKLSDIVIFEIYALVKRQEISLAFEKIINYLSKDRLSNSLSVWLASTLVGIRALVGQSQESEIDDLISIYDERAEKLKNENSALRDRYYNNVAFALAELGRIEDAEKVIGQISQKIHSSAYPTATFGLIQLKKGRIDRAGELYEKAIVLANNREDKIRIRQKYNFELGKYWMSQDERKSRRFFDKVIDQKLGEPVLSEMAKRFVSRISKHK